MTWLRVRNWERFQHYGDRNPPWIKLYVNLLTDYDYTRLSEVNRAHLIGIWLLASRNDGQVPHDAEWLGSRISAASPVDLDTLIRAGFLEPVPLAAPPNGATGVASISRDREETETEETRASTARVRARLPEGYRVDFDNQMRASHRPEALTAELAQILDGDQPATKGALPEDVGLALRDAALAGKKLSGAVLRGFVRGAMRSRQDRSSDSTHHPGGGRLTPLQEEFAAARAALAQESARA